MKGLLMKKKKSYPGRGRRKSGNDTSETLIKTMIRGQQVLDTHLSQREKEQKPGERIKPRSSVTHKIAREREKGVDAQVGIVINKETLNSFTRQRKRERGYILIASQLENGNFVVTSFHDRASRED